MSSIRPPSSYSRRYQIVLKFLDSRCRALVSGVGHTINMPMGGRDSYYAMNSIRHRDAKGLSLVGGMIRSRRRTL